LVDLFDEVEEELRSDRYRALFSRVFPYITGLLALVLVGYLAYWGFTVWQGRNMAAAAASYQKGLDDLDASNAAAASADFDSTVK
jgi:hypothetical protein